METSNGTPRKKHVLIVDDDVQLAWSLKEMLEAKGFEATIVPDGALALKFVLDHRPDAVVCDLQTSRVEGDLLYATLERSYPLLARRFVFIVGADEHSQFQKFIDTVELPVLRKPVAVEVLLDEVARAVERD
ncbi:MAG: response regulator [Verrucomicrobiia bacterium]